MLFYGYSPAPNLLCLAFCVFTRKPHCPAVGLIYLRALIDYLVQPLAPSWVRFGCSSASVVFSPHSPFTFPANHAWMYKRFTFLCRENCPSLLLPPPPLAQEAGTVEGFVESRIHDKYAVPPSVIFTCKIMQDVSTVKEAGSIPSCRTGLTEDIGL